jgi:hypothetical protein
MARLQATGIPWYRPQDYSRILAIMEDAHLLPPTYEIWREKAERLERDIKRSGQVVVRAVIDPEEFLVFCAARHLHVDAKARVAFANQATLRAVAKPD